MRKTTKDRPKEFFFPDIASIIPEKQLAGIGAIILAFNELEATLDQFLFIVTDLDSSLMWEISTRLGGLEHKIAIIKKGVEGILDLSEQAEFYVLFGEDWFRKIKVVRDCLAHLRHLNINNNVGQILKVSNDLKVFNVLAAPDVLDKAYQHLIAFHREIHSILQLVSNIKLLRRIGPDGSKKEQCELAISDCKLKIQQFRTYRQSLPPIPECPSEAELHEAEIQVQQAPLAMTMSALGQWELPPHFRQRNFSPALWNALNIQEVPLPLRESESTTKEE